MFDNLSHMYTLIIHPDNTFVYRIDNIEEAHGKLEDGWKFLAPKTINDPEDKKPADWVDEAQIPDPEDKKPEDWDDEDDVTMIFQLAVPCTGAGDLHLQILAALSRKLIYDEFRDQIAAAASAEEILALIGDQIGVQ